MLPQEIGDAAQDGDRDRVMAWLDAGGSVDDVDLGGYTLLNCCAVPQSNSYRDYPMSLVDSWEASRPVVGG